jgi:hypothetical protein
MVDNSVPVFDGDATIENFTVAVTLAASGNVLTPSPVCGDMVVEGNITLRRKYKNRTNEVSSHITQTNS